jgi:hypothetical protein
MVVALQVVIAVASVPLNVTVLVPWVVPKFVPVIVTVVPTVPVPGEIPVILGGATVKLAPLLGTPFTVTTIGPLVAPGGTGTTIEFALQPVGVAAVPLKVTVLVYWVDPKLVPVIVTDMPTPAVFVDRLTMLGACRIVNKAPLLLVPFTVTTTFPDVAPPGTAARIKVALQLVGLAAVPLNVIVLLPCVDPKLVPVIVTNVPAVPDVGDKLVMPGVCDTVNNTPLLDVPFTVTTTFPDVASVGTVATIDVALQLVTVAVVPLKVTDPEPCVAPKFEPEIVTAIPTGPEVRERLLMVGACDTVKGTPLLATPPTVTTTFPEVAPAGTGTVMLVVLQLVGVPAVPLKVTVLVPCGAPKFVPLIVTGSPGDPAFDDKFAIVGEDVCPVALSDTLSKVAVASADVLSLDTINPTNTFCAIVIV